MFKNIKFKIFYILLIVILVGQGAFSQENALELTLEEAIATALNQNLELQSEKAQIPIGEAGVAKANAIPNPEFFSIYAVGRNTDDLIGINQIFELGFKRKARKNVALAKLNVISSEVEQKAWELRNKVKLAFINLYIAQEKIKANQKIIENTKKLREIAQKRETAGKIPYTDLLQAESELLKAQTQLENAEIELKQAQTELIPLLNLPSAIQIQAVKLESSLGINEIITDNPDYKQETCIEELQKIAYSSRPELKIIETKKNVAKKEIILAKKNRIPDLELGAGIARINPESNQDLLLQANFDIPIWYRQQGEIKEAEKTIDKLGIDENALKKNIEAEVRKNFLDVSRLRFNLYQYDKKIIPVENEIIEKTRIRYELGKDPLVISLTAQKSYFDIVIEYLNILKDYHDSISRLEYGIGKPI